MTDTAYADLPRSRREWAEDLVRRLRSESHAPPLRGRWLAYDSDDAFVSKYTDLNQLDTDAEWPQVCPRREAARRRQDGARSLTIISSWVADPRARGWPRQELRGRCVLLPIRAASGSQIHRQLRSRARVRAVERACVGSMDL